MNLTTKKLYQLISEALEDDKRLHKLANLFLSGDIETIRQALIFSDSLGYTENYEEDVEDQHGTTRSFLSIKFSDPEFYSFLKNKAPKNSSGTLDFSSSYYDADYKFIDEELTLNVTKLEDLY